MRRCIAGRRRRHESLCLAAVVERVFTLAQPASSSCLAQPGIAGLPMLRGIGTPPKSLAGTRPCAGGWVFRVNCRLGVIDSQKSPA
jgi:hypothetical protein